MIEIAFDEGARQPRIELLKALQSSPGGYD
jgi:hypothetical protein